MMVQTFTFLFLKYLKQTRFLEDFMGACDSKAATNAGGAFEPCFNGFDLVNFTLPQRFISQDEQPQNKHIRF